MDAKNFNTLMSGVLDSDNLNEEIVYDLFLEQLQTKLKEGQTLEVKEVGFFKLEDTQTVLFISEQDGDEQLFEKISLAGKSESAYDFKDDVFSVGGNVPLITAEEATDEEQVEKLNMFSKALNEKLDTFPVLDNFDPLEYSQKSKTDLPNNDFKDIAYIDDIAVKKEVQLGCLEGWKVLITEGLKAGDQVLVEGQRGVEDGQRINIVRTLKSLESLLL
jgi:hypothetical protein